MQVRDEEETEGSAYKNSETKYFSCMIKSSGFRLDKYPGY